MNIMIHFSLEVCAMLYLNVVFGRGAFTFKYNGMHLTF